MSVLQVRIDGDPILRQVASEVDVRDPAIARLAIDMLDTVVETGGMGLAAPQVGQSVRVIAMRTNVSDGCPRVFVNPQIIRTKGEQLSLGEGCLSVPGKYGRVLRPRKLWLRYDDIATGLSRIEEFQGVLAACVAHEVDHLDGVLFTDKLYNPLARRK
jgi:peptide deformylase